MAEEKKIIKIQARPGQIREVQLSNGESFTLEVEKTTGTVATILIEPGSAIKRVVLDESASNTNVSEDQN